MSYWSIAALVVGGLLLNLAFLNRLPSLSIIAGFLYAFAIWKG